MTTILITGMSGTGKSTVLNLLRSRGYSGVETDEPGWCLPADGDWSTHDKDWLWDEARIARLLDDHAGKHLFVSGCRPNQGTFYHRFDSVVVFRAPIDVVIDRVTARNNNPFGHTSSDRQAIIEDTQQFEPLLIRSADLVIDTSVSIPGDIADELEALL